MYFIEHLLYFSFIFFVFSLFLFLTKQTLRMFPQRMSGEAFVSWSEESRVSFQMQKLEVLLFQLLMKRKCDPLMVFMFLVNLKCLKITWANTW